MEGRYSTRSPAVKRLMKEAQELCEPTDQYFAQPLEDNLFEWHFTIRGPGDSDFQAGIYHGRIVLPVDYPMKPPSIIWLTPNGRFETNKKICLSISGYHPESWQPSWSIRTALLAIIGFMPTHPSGAIGSLDYKPEERKSLAKKSRDWKCPVCGDVSEILLDPSPESARTSQEAKELAAQISFQGEKPKFSQTTSETSQSTDSPAEPEAAAASVAPTNTDQTQTEPPAQQQPHPFMYPPVFPLYNNTVLPPFFSYPWGVMPQGAGPAALIPRFPYPPSHYSCLASNSQFPPGGYTQPACAGAFPYSVLPRSTAERTSSASLSVNNSSASPPGSSPNVTENSNSPQTPSPIPEIPPPSPESFQQSASSSDAADSSLSSPLKANLLTELLKKVKEGRSDEDADSQAVQNTRNQAAKCEDMSAPNVPESSPATTAAGAKQLNPKAEVYVPVELLSDTGGVLTQTKPDTNSWLAMKHSDKNGSTYAEALVSQQMDVLDGLNTSFNGLEESEGGEHECRDDAEKMSEHECRDDAEKMSEHECRDDAEKMSEHECRDDAEKMSEHTSIDQTDNIEHDNDIGAGKSAEAKLEMKESQSEQTGKEISHSVHSADAEDNSEAGTLPIDMSDTEQKSNFERSTSSSVPNLELRQKLGAAKSLRQRQSATAYLSSEATRDSQLADQAGGQRIEAMSGDSSAPNRLLQPAMQNQAVDGQQVQRPAQARQGRVQFETSYFVMVCLCLATIFILINRIYNIVYSSKIF